MTKRPFAFDAIEHELYEDLPLVRLAAYAMHQLDELHVSLTLENITVALFMLFPGKFSMIGYPEYPDATRANRTLVQMQPKYRNYACGTATQGYTLTSIGVGVAEDTDAAFISGVSNRPHKGDTPRTKYPQEDIDRARQSRLYRLFKEGKIDSAKGIHIYSMLDVFAHSPKSAIRKRIEELKKTAGDLEDTEFLDFLKACEQHYSDILG